MYSSVGGVGYWNTDNGYLPSHGNMAFTFLVHFAFLNVHCFVCFCFRTISHEILFTKFSSED